MRNKIGIFIENRFIDKEIIYYMNRFVDDGFEAVLITRLWGQPLLTFKGMELGMEVSSNVSFEELTQKELSEYAAIIMPAGYVADYLLYSEKPREISPAAAFIKNIMNDKSIIKGFICHALWIAAPVKDVFENRLVTCHNNIIYHVENAGMTYVDEDVMIDGDLITARTGGHFGIFAKTIIDTIKKRSF